MLSTLGERMSKSNAGQGSESTSNDRSTVAAGKRRQSRGMRGQKKEGTDGVVWVTFFKENNTKASLPVRMRDVCVCVNVWASVCVCVWACVYVCLPAYAPICVSVCLSMATLGRSKADTKLALKA